MSKKIYIGDTQVLGADGKSAYQSWLDEGNTGTVADFLASLMGVGYDSVSSQQDGTVVITLTNGDTVTIDLNHTHEGLLPEVTSSDNDKIMKVVSGEWALVTDSGGGSQDAVLYTSQSLTSEQQAQARTNIGAGTYSKPNGGIPASDLASGVVSVNDVTVGGTSVVSSGTAVVPAIPNITISSSEPTSSDGENGDIWIVI